MQTDSASPARTAKVVLHVAGLSKRYVQGGWLSRKRVQVQALSEVELTLRAGSTLALVGASGSGKSTLARCLVCLEKAAAGEIWFEGKNLASLTSRELVPFRQQIQLIFQDPTGSLNPRLNAVEIISEPLLISGMARKKRRERALELMELVGLSPDWGRRSTGEFSGGQRRRLAIARALALNPKVIVLDEALAGLDLSIQGQISNLLQELQAARGLSYLFISHDLGLIAHLADEVAVLDHGRIVEKATAQEWLGNAQSFQSQALLDAATTLACFAGSGQ